MTTEALSISEECSTLAFNEIYISSKSAESFYDESVAVLSHFQLSFTHGSVCWNRVKKGWRKFPGLAQKLSKEGFVNVTSIELVSLLSKGDDPWAPYYLVAYWQAKHRKAFITLRSSLRSGINWKGVAENLISRISPAYGIGYRRDRKNKPDFFAMGLGGGIDYEESSRISGWGLAKTERVCRAGLLRDVFEWNFLTQPHLDRPVGGLTLKEWIEEDASRGTLSRINDHVTLWEVEVQYQPDIRQTLCEADVIYERYRH